MIANIETAILNKLQADAEKPESILSMVEIELCPEDAASRLMNLSTGVVWIHYVDTKTTEPEGVYSAVQQDTVSFDLDIITRNLRSGCDITVDNVGAYDVIDRVRKVLTGFRPVLGAKPMYMTASGWTDAGQGFWHYTARFAVKLPYVEEQDAESDLQPLPAVAKQVTWKHRTGKQFTVPKEANDAAMESHATD